MTTDASYSSSRKESSNLFIAPSANPHSEAGD